MHRAEVIISRSVTKLFRHKVELREFHRLYFYILIHFVLVRDGLCWFVSHRITSNPVIFKLCETGCNSLHVNLTRGNLPSWKQLVWSQCPTMGVSARLPRSGIYSYIWGRMSCSSNFILNHWTPNLRDLTLKWQGRVAGSPLVTLRKGGFCQTFCPCGYCQDFRENH